MAVVPDPQHYVHFELSRARSIRVFDLGPAAEESDAILGSLREVSLDDAPAEKYHALSYTWGSPVVDRAIRIDDQTFMITENCFIALKRLRQPSDTLTVWIDSICINQKHLAERNSQVALMGEIYVKSHSVVIWIGDWDEGIRDAVRIIKNIADPFLVVRNPSATADDKENAQHEAFARAREVERPAKAERRDRLMPFFFRARFERIWCIQEIALGSCVDKHVIVFNRYTSRGYDDMLAWPALMVVVDTLRAIGYRGIDLDGRIGLQQHLVTAIRMNRNPVLAAEYNATRTGGRLGSRAHGWTLAIDMRAKQAGEIKDKVFGLYGIFQELQIAVTVPDYSKSVNDIYREITVAMIKHDADIQILFDVPSDRRREDLNLPSWVPDFSDTGWRSAVVDSRVALTGDRFCAAGPSHPQWVFLDDDRRLQVKAKIIGMVAECRRPLDVWHPQGHVEERTADRGPGSGQTMATFKEWVILASSITSYPNKETWEQALCRTLCQDSPETIQEQRDFDAWLACVKSFAGRATGVISTLIMVGRYAFNWYSAHAYHYLMIAFMLRKTFYTTDNGYMGTAPAIFRHGKLNQMIREGDRIALVAGMCMPIVLRPVHGEPKCFKWVTHTYLHGFMYGEGWEDEANEEEEISLM